MEEHEKAIRDGAPIVPCLAALDKQGPHVGEKMVYIDDEVEMEMRYNEPTVKRGWSTALRRYDCSYDIRVHGATYARLGMCGDSGPMFEFIRDGDTFLLPHITKDNPIFAGPAAGDINIYSDGDKITLMGGYFDCDFMKLFICDINDGVENHYNAVTDMGDQILFNGMGLISRSVAYPIEDVIILDKEVVIHNKKLL